MTKSLYERHLQEIKVVVFIILDWMFVIHDSLRALLIEEMGHRFSDYVLMDQKLFVA